MRLSKSASEELFSLVCVDDRQLSEVAAPPSIAVNDVPPVGAESGENDKWEEKIDSQHVSKCFTRKWNMQKHCQVTCLSAFSINLAFFVLCLLRMLVLCMRVWVF
jgi:hypothetical protein